MKTYLKYITPSDYANPTRSTCSQIFLQQYFTVIQLLVLIFGYQKLTVSVPFPCSLFGFLEWQQVILKIRELILCLNWCYIFLNERLYLSKSLSGTFQFILQKTVMWYFGGALLSSNRAIGIWPVAKKTLVQILVEQLMLCVISFDKVLYLCCHSSTSWKCELT